MWFVLQVKTGCEESIRDKLIELGLFVPKEAGTKRKRLSLLDMYSLI